MVKGISHYWTKAEIRKQLEVIRGNTAPSKVITNAQWLNSVRKCWMEGNIWIYNDRIIYVGDRLPKFIDSETEVFDATDHYVVPGYIEHHAHPFQLYNPLTLAQYACQLGTTTLINDNLLFFLQLNKKKALTLLNDLQNTSATLLWWVRFDSQTELLKEEELFAYSTFKAWLDHPYVVQGGELTGWPSVLDGDDTILHWMLETKDVRKPIEGHFPGAGEKTLTQMAILGVDSDHESMSGEDVIRRIDLGMTASLRHSSIRPDLPKLLTELHDSGMRHYDKLLMTTDGSPPSFFKNGFMDELIKIAMDNGVPLIEAIGMCTYNVAKHYHLDDTLGMIAPGRLANINILSSLDNPLPKHVLGKGQWLRKDNEAFSLNEKFPWENYGFKSFDLDWDLNEEDLHFSIPVGLEMVNEVILKPYRVDQDLTLESLHDEKDECFFMLIDRHGKWSLSTAIKGFAKNLHGLASSFSSSGDIILIGKNKEGLLQAFHELKKQKGGIVVVEKGGPVASIPLEIAGLMSDQPVEELINKEKHLKDILAKRGYSFADPIYSLLFFTATHLPYIRVTQTGIVDVKKKKVLFPSIMR
ncbi:adenine deaminase C-terminal domain-containing protein [Evansella sp. AB-P1]|uniref:adenine deaminase C-terminal domain-containing protein n=1 Tax=Evansella sp. AB-P1 TaxID=3037653 RepID=UPI00241C4928|nr:adenine deaminase C-terminal domain-containing protein [Evansella sp. AB-P1]MDG5785942.1 adenine deaminase C-terminal domain-containing protein [Evansella sp. AB-P1]